MEKMTTCFVKYVRNDFKVLYHAVRISSYFAIYIDINNRWQMIGLLK